MAAGRLNSEPHMTMSPALVRTCHFHARRRLFKTTSKIRNWSDICKGCSPGYRQRLTDALSISERAKERRQAQADCKKPANVFEVGQVVGMYGIGTPGCTVRAGSKFRSHVGLPLLRNLKPPFAAHGDRFASSKLVRWRSFSRAMPLDPLAGLI